jgi:hypothetical protein
MTNIERVEAYLYRFFKSRFDEFDAFYKNTYQERVRGIYKLEDGNYLMDYLDNIHRNIANVFFQKHWFRRSLRLQICSFKI